MRCCRSPPTAAMRCRGASSSSTRLFADLDPTHRGLLRASCGERTVTGVLGPDQPRLALDPDGRSRWEQFVDYAREGVWHIWIGFDHVLFLLSLLLPAVLAGAALCAGVLGRVQGRHRVHRRALDHAVARRALRGDAALAAGRIGDRRLGGARGAQQPLAGGAASALAGGVRLRPDPRLRLRQRARRPGPAAGKPARRAARLQPRRRGGSARHRGACSCRSPTRCARPGSIAASCSSAARSRSR